MEWKEKWKEIAAVLYPPECPVCQKLLVESEDRRRHIHGLCYQKLRRIVEPMCRQCGKPLLSVQQECCFDCRKRQSSACESGHSLWIYDAVTSQSIFAYKYDGKQSYAEFYGEALVHFYRGWIESLHVQQLIPVPLSRRKERKRGFNQAALLAEKIGERTGIPVNTRGLLRLHSTAPQKELGKHERNANLKNAFVADEEYLSGVQRVLLIDDIYTTGSTVHYCAEALKRAGVRKVWFLTLCTGGAF